MKWTNTNTEIYLKNMVAIFWFYALNLNLQSKNIQEHLKNVNIMKKVNVFCHSIQNVKPYII